jgi:hypothetical protein
MTDGGLVPGQTGRLTVGRDESLTSECADLPCSWGYKFGDLALTVEGVTNLR